MTSKILLVGRGMPSGGHVSTCLSIGKALQQNHSCETLYVSYGPGSTLLKFVGANFVELPYPASSTYTHRTFPGWDLFELQDHLKPIIDQFQPNLVVCDGELYLPLYCRILGIPCVSIASPNYIDLNFPPYSDYAELIARMLNMSTRILGYAAKECKPSALLNPDHLWMIPPLMKYDKSQLSRQAARQKYGYAEDDILVLIYKGAGNVLSHDFIEEANKIADVPVQAYLKCLQYKYPKMKLLIISGTQVDCPENENIRVEHYVDFMEIAYASNLVVARAGRNVIYEMAYLGVPSILIGIDSKTDLQHNCDIAEEWHIAHTIQSTDLYPDTFCELVSEMLHPEKVQALIESGQQFVSENGTSIAADKIMQVFQSVQQ